MGFFDMLGKLVKPKNIFTAMGAFSPLGPVGGAAAGRAVGGALESATDEDKDFNPVGDALAGAALGGVGHFGAGMIGKGTAPMAAEAAAPRTTTGPLRTVATGAAAPAAAGEQAGGFAGGFWGGLSPAEKAGLVGQGLGAAANVYSAYEMGRLEDERDQRRRRLDRELAPLLRKTLRGMGG